MAAHKITPIELKRILKALAKNREDILNLHAEILRISRDSDAIRRALETHDQPEADEPAEET